MDIGQILSYISGHSAYRKRVDNQDWYDSNLDAIAARVDETMYEDIRKALDSSKKDVVQTWRNIYLSSVLRPVSLAWLFKIGAVSGSWYEGAAAMTGFVISGVIEHSFEGRMETIDEKIHTVLREESMRGSGEYDQASLMALD